MEDRENAEPQIPPLLNGDENASPTGLLRTVNDTLEQAHGPVGTAVLCMSVWIQATSYSFSRMLLGEKWGKMTKKALWEVHYNMQLLWSGLNYMNAIVIQ